jgi:hypothetical protein
MNDDIVARLRAVLRDDRSVELLAHAAAAEIVELRVQRDELCEALREISQMKDEPYSAEFAADTLHHVRLV